MLYAREREIEREQEKEREEESLLLLNRFLILVLLVLVLALVLGLFPRRCGSRVRQDREREGIMSVVDFEKGNTCTHCLYL